MSKATRLIVILLLPALFGSLAVHAHIGSPTVFYEGNAGPYNLRVTIRPPEVVPGRAQINVRVHNGPVARVTVLPVRWDAGRKGAPPPDFAAPVDGETNLFNAELWLMDFGAYSVFVEVVGERGHGTAIVPLNSVAQKRLQMSPALAVMFLVAGSVLVLLLVFIIGSAVRESVLPPSVPPGQLRNRRARFAMAGAVLVISLAMWRGNAWWAEVDAEFRNNRLFKPIEISTELRVDGPRAILALKSDATESDWRDQTPLVADHGKLMHLFLIRGDMESFAHLHPKRVGDDIAFEAALPALPPGEYSVYGEVTHESGLARTLVSSITIPELPRDVAAVPADPDDSWWPVAAGNSAEVSVRQLVPGPFFAGQEVTLRFDALAPDGQPALLEPYMGMWSHAVVRAVDGSVFTHLHPSGTISMAAQELFARRERGEDLRKPIDVVCGRPQRELIFPYLFPRPGQYRMWVQVKVAGKIVTAPFDIEVQAPAS